MNLTYLVTGFPTKDHPSRGIFNLRAAEGLSDTTNLTVIHVRLYRPGRRLRQVVHNYQWKHIELALPLMPILHQRGFQEYLTIADWILGRIFGRCLCRDILAHTDMFHSVGAAFAGPVCAVWARKYNARHVMQIVGSDVNFELPLLVRRSGGKQWMRWVHGIAANSRDLAEKYTAQYPDATHVRTVYRGTDLSTFKPLNMRPPGRPVFLYLGGLPAYSPAMHGMNQKGGITLMEAWREYERDTNGNPAEMIFAGPGARQPMSVRWRDHLIHPDRVILQEEVPPEDVPDLINRASVVIIPSMADGLPNVGMEALACGRPIIGSRTGGIPELVVPDVNGWLFEPGDVKGLTRRIREAAHSDDATVTAFSRAARRRAETVFNREQYIPQLMSLYEDVSGHTASCAG